MGKGHMKRSISYILFVVVLLIAARSNGQWQWKKIHTFNSRLNVVYFVPPNDQIGFAGLHNGSLWRTTNRGESWDSVLLAASGTWITDVHFINELEGWCTSRLECYSTIDGGQHWTMLTTPGLARELTSIYYHQTTKLLFLSSISGLHISPNNGGWWSDHFIGRAAGGFAFSDDLHGINTSVNTGGYCAITSDGGVTWTLTERLSTAWQPACFEGSSAFFAATGLGVYFQRSFDYGKSWEVYDRTSAHIKNTSTLRADRCFRTLYIVGISGFYCTFDSGMTWRGIGGPPNFISARFTISSHEIFAGDLYGGLWQGTPNNVHFTTSFSTTDLSFESVSLCSYKDLNVSITNRNCDLVVVDTFWLTGSPLFSIVEPYQSPNALTHGSTLDFTIRFFPLDLRSESGQLHVRLKMGRMSYDTIIYLSGKGESNTSDLFEQSVSVKETLTCTSHDTVVLIRSNCDTLFLDSMRVANGESFKVNFEQMTLPPSSLHKVPITFSPITSGMCRDTLLLRFRILNRVFDSVIYLAGKGLRNTAPIAFSSTKLLFDQITPCEDKTLTTFLVNRGCEDSLFIEPHDLPVSEFELFTPRGGIWIAPHDSIPIRIGFRSKNIGKYSSVITFKGKMKDNSSVYAQLSLEGEIVDAVSSLAVIPDNFIFDTLTCSEIDTFTFLLQPSVTCDSVSLVDVYPEVVNDFHIITSLQFPHVLRPGDSLAVNLQFHPAQEGVAENKIRIEYKIRGVRKTKVIDVKGFYSGGYGHLECTTSSIDFGTVTLCEERDSSVTMTNTGCDTLILTSASLIGKGFSITSEFPIVLPPREAREVEVMTTADTIGGATSNSATITFTSNADNQIPSVTLSRSYEFAPSYDIAGLSMSDLTGTASDFVNLQIIAGDWWKTDNVMHGVQRLDFDLAMNRDLLHYVSSSGANRVSVNGKRVTVEGNPEIVAPGGVLAEFFYQVHLTEDTMTDIVLSNLVLNNGDSTPCKPTIFGGGSSGFTYRYVCGDRAIQTFLRTGKAIDITNIRPNPARDEVTVEIVAEGTVAIEVYDAVGKLVLTTEGKPGVVVVPVDTLASGSYVLRATSGGGVLSRSFVVER
jgi:photosystem II stability/assembly factor-like uncharacterized protein